MSCGARSLCAAAGEGVAVGAGAACRAASGQETIAAHRAIAGVNLGVLISPPLFWWTGLYNPIFNLQSAIIQSS
jgi:hypothetical protein